MKYMGSKDRHSKELLSIMLPYLVESRTWVEPFVGGGNIIDKVPNHFSRLGGDVNYYLIALLKAASVGWLPPQRIGEEQYIKIKEAPFAFDAPLVGYCAFALSYGGKYFGGWRRDGEGNRDYVGEAYRNALNQFPKLVGCEFIRADYQDLPIPDNSVIYCDPPYKGATEYIKEFDSEKFYAWCRNKSQEGHTIFISEYCMPLDFKVVWEKNVTSSLAKDTGSKQAIEKLFTLENTHA